MGPRLVTLLLIAGAVVAFSLAVGGQFDPAESAEVTAANDSASIKASERSDIQCPFEDGGACRGLLKAGTYSTTDFSPAITYTVPEGWTNREDRLGNFLLFVDDGTYDGDPDYLFAGARYLAAYRNVRAPDGCQELFDRDVGMSVDALVGWLTGHPGLVTSEPQPVTVGGLDGVFLDVSLDPSWTKTCPHTGTQEEPVVPFLIGGGPSGLHHMMLPALEERLYIFDYQGGNVAIEISPQGRDLNRFLQEVEPIVEDLQFAV